MYMYGISNTSTNELLNAIANGLSDHIMITTFIQRSKNTDNMKIKTL